MTENPLAVGLHVCEQVIIEAGTGNVTLVNCFKKREVRRFPVEGAAFVIFAVLTNGAGEMPLDILIECLDNDEVVFRRSHRIKFADPLEEMRLIARVRGFTFPIPGHYQISLVANREVLAQRAVQLLEKAT